MDSPSPKFIQNINKSMGFDVGNRNSMMGEKKRGRCQHRYRAGMTMTIVYRGEAPKSAGRCERCGEEAKGE